MSAEPLPFVCAWCARVRSEAGRWEDGEGTDLTTVEATHGICPPCHEACRGKQNGSE